MVLKLATTPPYVALTACYTIYDYVSSLECTTFFKSIDTICRFLSFSLDLSINHPKNVYAFVVDLR